ncbi:MAG TPA: 2-succinyl-5-enolpyruvyl-6-hydroxy-3-cyclohexene-1-carboxylic-acid synthase, partial [Dermacoccus sp.]|nr:2-succinyl-5-enolpyruvyl-6-hydroxy-3-cyclohexene-1-carboxylic-acid synthase [Dermacoccus sp.]
ARDTSATSDEEGRADDAPPATAPVWPESLEGRDRGRPWMQLRAPASTVTVAPGPGIAPVPRTLVLLGDLPDPKLAAEV